MGQTFDRHVTGAEPHEEGIKAAVTRVGLLSREEMKRTEHRPVCTQNIYYTTLYKLMSTNITYIFVVSTCSTLIITHHDHDSIETLFAQHMQKARQNHQICTTVRASSASL